ncbi:PBECR2 nuclease fold domain-containing protein [Pseudomonas retamae]|uniref:PBECR2 nuclease fold domain-containing protein n=1 Tax=Pseudomonas retamae TaxID=702110 RepID=A0ABW7D9X8_9PSED
MGLQVSRALPDQNNWKDLKLPDIRDIDPELLISSVSELPSASSLNAAWEQVARGFGLDDGLDAVLIETPYAPILVKREHLLHAVEKRPNARERFTLFARDTLTNPFEIWRVRYDDASFRLSFIGAYDTKYQMLVVIHIERGNVLWNFMNCDRKGLNKHRHGELLYQRYE